MRTISATRMPKTSQMITGRGSHAKEPLPRKISPGWLKVRIAPSVTSWAMPRPATISTSVAMIGWISSIATRTPFHRPQRMPVPSVIRSVIASEWPDVIDEAATAPQIAITAPTERSMPLVAMTTVMPMARSTTGAPRLRMSMTLP
ncbi:hypothetical protein D9M69_614910 [compost metagenome]